MHVMFSFTLSFWVAFCCWYWVDLTEGRVRITIDSSSSEEDSPPMNNAFQSCADNIKNQDETDVDCGGIKCPKCTNTMICNADCDCISDLCKNNRCTPAESCNDNMKNQDETDVDCGGAKCPRCENMKTCNQPSDCISGFCINNKCVPAESCHDNVTNQDETDVDCGGATCPKCDMTKSCNQSSDCSSGYCNSDHICSIPFVNRRVKYYLTVAYAANSSSIVLINNQVPAPLIEAELNDLLVIHVTNYLPESERLAIHFHGLFVRQAPNMDGVAYVTQLPIESQKSFTYVIPAYPAGTFFYHSHAGLQSVTAFGPIIIHDRRRPWNVSEVTSGPLLFSDLWFSPDRLTQEYDLLASPFVWEGEPTYLLINGKRDFVLTVDPNRKYLLRLIGATTLSTIVFGIDEHPMTVVEVDGVLIKPKENVNSIELSSGQRYAVIIQTKSAQSKGIYLMELSIRWRTLVNGSNCTGVLRYSSVSAIPTDLSSLSSPPLASAEDLRLFSFNNPFETLEDIDQMPRRAADKEIFLFTNQAHTPDGLGLRWVINNGSLDKLRLINLTRPLLFDLYNGIEDTLPEDVTYTLDHYQLVDIVLQNSVAANGVCESHPFHLHGHKFWIHSQGTGMYDASQNINPSTNKPVFRDTLTLYASSYSNLAPNRSTNNYLKPCGWIKMRILADNPGLWLLHCHIGSHLFMGMSVLLKEDIEHLTMNFASPN